MSQGYSTQELMIIAAAREINDYERIFVGMRLPIAAYGVARLTHAPNAVGLFESGVCLFPTKQGEFSQIFSISLSKKFLSQRTSSRPVRGRIRLGESMSDVRHRSASRWHGSAHLHTARPLHTACTRSHLFGRTRPPT